MHILSIDTSETQCAAAIVTSSGESVAKTEDIGRGHAERLLPMVDELLAQCAITYADLGRIVVVTGPGTFTGLRIGLSVARGLAVALGIPCVGITSLAAVAARAYSEGVEGVAHSIIKGRAGQVFHQAYSGVDDTGFPLYLSSPANMDAEKAAALVQENHGIVVGTGADMVLLPESDTALYMPGIMADPVVLAKIGALLPPDSYPPEPAYYRDADAAKARPAFLVQTGS
ncbi:tRNA (adenosine(37)-N6)-threonylcarbamoyltransferase complex dimerization subunit type 1 TsaB [Kordiimonas pumila]|uniref:tRNA (Adenosine(37)-N6)-threonylcarbamoyltransferase complex dimerization subunit type 1 TsaB n=1 Tax=Kordiimonas pumila TaxID=2161677 RepID=A0ABV7D031_9PROT|nr:tRNA (adenosine(37)-N6)-threonylcarbamoyltransferase complex dimerization subunit type 1 TsaB [Kordiimonas pumila]